MDKTLLESSLDVSIVKILITRQCLRSKVTGYHYLQRADIKIFINMEMLKKIR